MSRRRDRTIDVINSTFGQVTVFKSYENVKNEEKNEQKREKIELKNTEKLIDSPVEDDKYEGERDFFGIDSVFDQTAPKKINFKTSNDETNDNVADVSKHLIDKDLNYIDNVYFNNEDDNIERVSGSNVNISKNEITEDKSLNFIDKTFFSGNIQIDEKPENNGDSNVSVSKNEIIEDKSLNFIDEQFIKNEINDVKLASSKFFKQEIQSRLVKGV